MIILIEWFLILCSLVTILYKIGTRNYNYWKKQGVQQLPTLPFIGNNVTGMFNPKTALEISQDFYFSFKKERFGGIYVGQKPFLTVSDRELVRKMLVRDADCFFNRYDWSMSVDPLFGRNLLNLTDENWKKMRHVLTSMFTASKMKDMFGFMDKCAKQATQYLQEKVSEHAKSDATGNTAYATEFKEFYCRYGTDVIGTTAFGFEVDSFKYPDNEFYVSGNVMHNVFKGANAFKIYFMMTFPSISKMLGLTFLGTKYYKYFSSLIEDAIREREEKNISRMDVIHILMEARKSRGIDKNGEPIKGKLPDLTDLDIAAQAILFFFAGFKTMSNLSGFISSELAANPDIQEKLQQEIDEVIEKENGITYDGVINQMNYLNMVVSETLRKWPPGPMTDRAVTRTYTIPKTDTSPELVLKRGDYIWIPTAGFHYDPEYFPNPHKFDPERFRNEKATVKPFTYLPFGEGLRHCVGMRYALMEVKVITVHLLRRFSFVPVKKSSIPVKLQKKGFFEMCPEDGFLLGVTPRQ